MASTGWTISLVFIASAAATAAPQTFNTALPVAEGEFVFREQFLYRKASGDPSRADREVEVLGAISVLGYGMTGDFAGFAVLPYLDKELGLTTASGARITRSTSGIGDARLFGRYTVYRDDAPGRTFRIAPFAGIELPTGDDDDSDGQGSLPATLQLGSGSWDPFGGVVATYQTLDYQIDAQASYKLNTEANGFEFGDEARLDASLQYRLWPRELGPGVPGFLYGVLEGNLLYRGKNEIGGIDDRDSGGTSLFLSPSLQYVTKRWIVEAIVQVPLVQDLNGDALEDDFTVRAGFRLNF
ncbi:transporter [Thalassospira profundimaris]|uniref:transporter n=1 Tax=Thalassospira profundimaris TaxID=502049 RepID=UPI001C691060|nr:transporter [Thalassospira profundimaris]